MDYDSPAMGYLILLLARYRQRMDTLQSFPSHPQGHKHQAQEHYPHNQKRPLGANNPSRQSCEQRNQKRRATVRARP